MRKLLNPNKMSHFFGGSPRRALSSLFILSLFAFSSLITPTPIYSAESKKSQTTASKKTTKKKSYAKKKTRKFINKRNRKTRRARGKSKRKPATRRKRTRYVKADGAKGTTAKIERFRNKVSIKSKDGSWSKASKNAKVKTSDKIKTGRRSMARVKLEDGSKVLILQNSEAEMDTLSTVQKTIRLLRGRVRAIVNKLKKARSFKIKTPIGVASVRGTEFEVEFLEDAQEMEVEVLKGQVGVSRLGDLSDEVVLRPGQSIRFGADGILGDPIQTGAIPINRREIRKEVQIAKVKQSVMAQAAEELRNADYQVGKSLIDVDGSRVRVEEYITRPAADQFKLVVLNERPTRFDYFTYTATFHQNLPTDLSIALRQVGGRLGTAPDYHLKEYEMLMSNTKDNIVDTGSGGHLVRIDFDGTNYTLTDVTDGTNTRTVAAAALQSDGSYKIYNPIKDTFQLVTAANLTEAMKISVLDSGVYRNLGVGDVFFKTRYNTSSFSINNVQKTAYTQKTAANTLAIDLDANFTRSPITTISEFPSGSGTLHNRLSLFYDDGSKLVYDNYIIDDEGKVADSNSFSGLSSSADYQNQLNNWNYQQKVTATEMEGRDINLVVDPRIGTISGLIQ